METTPDHINTLYARHAAADFTARDSMVNMVMTLSRGLGTGSILSDFFLKEFARYRDALMDRTDAQNDLDSLSGMTTYTTVEHGEDIQ